MEYFVLIKAIRLSQIHFQKNSLSLLVLVHHFSKQAKINLPQ